MTDVELIALARDAAKNSYSIYSHYPVGAALLADDGSVWQGANIENASFGLTNCAERSAIFSAVSHGKRKFVAIAIAGGTEDAPAFPCGACRQVIREFSDPKSMRVIVASLSGEKYSVNTLEELLPHSFGPTDLSK